MRTSNYIGPEKVYKNKANVYYTWEQFEQNMKSSARIEDENGAILIDYYDVEDILLHHFYSYSFNFFTHNDNPVEAVDAAIALYDRWIKFKFQRLSGIRKEFSALKAEYDVRYDYERYEDERQDKDELEHGLKRSSNVDIKNSTNTDFKTGTATDLKQANNTDITSSINTNMQESETLSTKKDVRPTWVADEQTTDKEETTPGTKTTSGTAENNYTKTEADENSNYTRTTGEYAKNYNRAVGIATDNYTQTQGDALTNFTEDSGKDTRTLDYGERHVYGSNSVPIDVIEKELNLRKINLKKDIVSEFVNSIAYFVYEV